MSKYIHLKDKSSGVVIVFEYNSKKELENYKKDYDIIYLKFED